MIRSLQSRRPCEPHQNSQELLREWDFARGLMNLLSLNTSLLGRYGFAVIAVAMGSAATFLVPTIGTDRPFLLFLFGAVLASSWIGGMGPGWLAVALSTLAIDFFYIPPVYAITGNLEDLPWLLAFIICSVIGNVLGSRYRRLETELREAQRLLRAHDAEHPKNSTR